MKSYFSRLAVVGLAFGLCTGAVAQTDAPIEYIPARNFTFSVGVRAATHKPKARFGQLGNVPSSRFNPAVQDFERTNERQLSRSYDNGSVSEDRPRGEELDADGNQITDPNGRYEVRTTENDVEIVVGTRDSFTPGQTRFWTFQTDDQINASDRSVAMSTYSTTSEGGTAIGEGETGGGFEFQLGRLFGRRGSRFEWGLVGSFGLNDVNIKTSQQVRATLHTLTDFYRIPGTGPLPTAPYLAPNFNEDYTRSDGVVVTGGVETTIPLEAYPYDQRLTSLAGGANVQGFWQIKGAYYMMRLGPNFRVRLSERFSVSGSAGVSGAYVGTTFRVDEYIVQDNVTTPVRIQEENTTSKFIAGFYGEANAEFWLTERTGFFGGVLYETLGKFNQKPLEGRTANVDLGSGLGFRFGIVTRF